MSRCRDTTPMPPLICLAEIISYGCIMTFGRNKSNRHNMNQSLCRNPNHDKGRIPVRTSLPWTCMLISARIITQPGVCAAEQPMPDATVSAIQVSGDFKLIPQANTDRFGTFGFDLVRWPELDEIKSLAVDVASNKVAQIAVTSTYEWASRMLKKEWLPNPSHLALLPMTNSVDGHDAVRFRYQVAGSVFQVTATSAGMAFLIIDDLPVANSNVFSQDQAVLYMTARLDTYFQEAERIKAITFKNVVQAKGGYEGRPVLGSEAFNNWWGRAGWWTDGRVFLVTAPTVSSSKRGGSRPPLLKKNWFRADEQAGSEKRD